MQSIFRRILSFEWEFFYPGKDFDIEFQMKTVKIAFQNQRKQPIYLLPWWDSRQLIEGRKFIIILDAVAL